MWPGFPLFNLFVGPILRSKTNCGVLYAARNTLIPDYDGKISEQAALSILKSMELVPVTCEPSISDDLIVITNHVHLPPENLSSTDSSLPIVFLHGFDSSLMEGRRLLPLLSKDFEVFAVDILGWGFNNHTNVKTFFPEAKIDHLRSYLQQYVRKPCVLVGASLGSYYTP